MRNKVRSYYLHHRKEKHNSNSLHMKSKKMKKMIGITALLGVTALTNAFAASTSTTGTHLTSHKGGKRGDRERGSEMKTLTAEEKTEHEGELAQNLATALGTTKEKVLADLAANKTVIDIIKSSGQDTATVEAKLKQVRDTDMKARVAADVASGKITQGEADKMATTMAEGKGMHGSKGMNFDKTRMVQDMSTILHIPVATILSDISDGKKPIDIVTSSGMSQADFETKMKALRMVEMKSRLQVEVSAGKMTQADADSKLAKMASHREGMKGMKSRVHAVKNVPTTDQ